MTMTRTLASALGAAALTLSLAIAAPSGAADRPIGDDPPSYRIVGGAGPGLLALVAPSRRSIYSGVVERDHRIYLRGDVEDYVKREVVVQRKGCESCDWRRHDVVRTGKHGWFRSQIGAPARGSTYWRARVAASGGYARSYSATWATFY